MAGKEFILQGFTPRTHLAVLREMFKINKIMSISMSIAFVNEGGVEQIEPLISPYANKTTIYAGSRNEITSYQGLKKLNGIIGNKLYTVDTGSRGLIFHPKIFLVRGISQAHLIVGSANLTLGGLNNNIESSLYLICDLSDPHDLFLINDISLKFGAMTTEYPNHVCAVESEDVLTAMRDSGRLVDEGTPLAPRSSTATRSGTSDTIPILKLKVPRLRRSLAKMSALAIEPVEDLTTNAPTKPVRISASSTVGIEADLIWQSKPLTRRDLTIPTGSKTNQTGSFNLDKGLLPEDVDHRHYFREVIFSNLYWEKRTSTVDEAYAIFNLIIKCTDYGEYDLAIRHTNSTETPTYLQRNAMTRLSWGPMRQHVAREDLIDRTLSIYRDRADPRRFILEID